MKLEISMMRTIWVCNGTGSGAKLDDKIRRTPPDVSVSRLFVDFTANLPDDELPKPVVVDLRGLNRVFPALERLAILLRVEWSYDVLMGEDLPLEGLEIRARAIVDPFHENRSLINVIGRLPNTLNLLAVTPVGRVNLEGLDRLTGLKLCFTSEKYDDISAFDEILNDVDRLVAGGNLKQLGLDFMPATMEGDDDDENYRQDLIGCYKSLSETMLNAYEQHGVANISERWFFDSDFGLWNRIGATFANFRSVHVYLITNDGRDLRLVDGWSRVSAAIVAKKGETTDFEFRDIAELHLHQIYLFGNMNLKLTRIGELRSVYHAQITFDDDAEAAHLALAVEFEGPDVVGPDDFRETFKEEGQLDCIGTCVIGGASATPR